MTIGLVEWLREACAEYVLEPIAIFRRSTAHDWPLIAHDQPDLVAQLEVGGHFLPLPKEPAALANVIEVSLSDFLIGRAGAVPAAELQRGTERGYPDLEVSGDHFGGGHHAIDIKVARRDPKSPGRTESRITLYTGNTYFRYPQIHWPGTFRPFQDYRSHLDVVAIYTLNPGSVSRIEEFEIIVQEAWRIASRQRSSTTREYLGAVMDIGKLRRGEGEFSSESEFYEFWRKHPFKIGRAAQRQLDRLLAKDSGAKP